MSKVSRNNPQDTSVCHVLRSLLLFFATTLSPAVYAAGAFDTVYFAEESNWPPYTPDTYGIAREGLALELMEAIFSPLGLKVEIELVPQERMLQYLRLGEKDAVTVITKNTERMAYLDYTDVIISGDRGLIYYAADREKPFVWQTFEDLQGLLIGVTSGHNYGAEFNRAVQLFDLKLVEVTRVRQNFDMLVASRVDIVMAAESTANDILQDPKFNKKIAVAEKPTREINFHIAFSKKSRAKVLIPQVNGVIRQLRAEGSLQAIVDRY